MTPLLSCRLDENIDFDTDQECPDFAVYDAWGLSDKATSGVLLSHALSPTLPFWDKSGNVKRFGLERF